MGPLLAQSTTPTTFVLHLFSGRDDDKWEKEQEKGCASKLTVKKKRREQHARHQAGQQQQEQHIPSIGSRSSTKKIKKSRFARQSVKKRIFEKPPYRQHPKIRHDVRYLI